jgi:hypothetical protein
LEIDIRGEVERYWAIVWRLHFDTSDTDQAIYSFFEGVREYKGSIYRFLGDKISRRFTIHK